MSGLVHKLEHAVNTYDQATLTKVWTDATGVNFSLNEIATVLTQYQTTMTHNIAEALIIYIIVPLLIITFVVTAILVAVGIMSVAVMAFAITFAGFVAAGIGGALIETAHQVNMNRNAQLVAFMQNQQLMLEKLPAKLVDGIIALACYHGPN
jgi:type III secretory pathway component EscR